MSTALTASGNRVCLVTEELSGVGSSGGIGAAFLELAQLLANQGMSVDVLYCPIAGSLDPRDYPKLSAKFAADGIKLSFLDAGKWVVEPLTYEKRAYAIARHFMASEVQYDFIHFHDYKGLGFFCTSLKRQGLAFAETRLVVQLHGPTRWTIDANQGFFSHEDQLKIDHMERLSIAQADCVVSPSAYLLDWMRGNGFELPADARVIKNVCSNLSESLQRFRARLRDAKTDVPVSDIVFFARHEDRKGFAVFCDALELIKDELARGPRDGDLPGQVRHGGQLPLGRAVDRPCAAVALPRARAQQPGAQRSRAVHPVSPRAVGGHPVAGREQPLHGAGVHHAQRAGDLVAGWRRPRAVCRPAVPGPVPDQQHRAVRAHAVGHAERPAGTRAVGNRRPDRPALAAVP